MDPLSDVLSLLKARNLLSAGLDAGGAWSIQFPDQRDAIKCGAVVTGACWLSVEGSSDAVRLESGDSFLLPHGRPFRLASELALVPTDALAIFPAARRGGIVTHNGGGDCFVVSCRFGLAGHHAGVLLRMLPPLVHLRSESEHAALRWSVERMMQELREPQPGGFLIIQHLAHLMLVQALRRHLLEGTQRGVGWLFALSDRQMSAAISALHEDPAHHWTLQELAQRVGMSRSSFALKFKEMVGTSPIEYLMRWRMLLAGDRLEHTRDSVSTIALSLGYESESAFSTAFKRVMGVSPRQYGRSANADFSSGRAFASDDAEQLIPLAGRYA